MQMWWAEASNPKRGSRPLGPTATVSETRPVISLCFLSTEVSNSDHLSTYMKEVGIRLHDTQDFFQFPGSGRPWNKKKKKVKEQGKLMFFWEERLQVKAWFKIPIITTCSPMQFSDEARTKNIQRCRNQTWLGVEGKLFHGILSGYKGTT